MRPRSGGEGEEIARLGHAEEEAYNKTRKEDDGRRASRGGSTATCAWNLGPMPAYARECTRPLSSSSILPRPTPPATPFVRPCPPALALPTATIGRFDVECRPGQLGDHARTEMRTTQDARSTRRHSGTHLAEPRPLSIAQPPRTSAVVKQLFSPSCASDAPEPPPARRLERLAPSFSRRTPCCARLQHCAVHDSGRVSATTKKSRRPTSTRRGTRQLRIPIQPRRAGGVDARLRAP